MLLANGDTVNPFRFAAFGVASPFGTAEQLVLKLLRGETTFREVCTEIDELLLDCDSGHTELMRKLPHDEDAHALVVQWALTSPKLSLLIDTLKRQAALPEEKVGRDDYARAAVIYDMLNTRFMTLFKNGAVAS